MDVTVNLYSAVSHSASNALSAPNTAETDASYEDGDAEVWMILHTIGATMLMQGHDILTILKVLTVIRDCDGTMRKASAAFWSHVRAVTACSSNSANLSRNTGSSRPCTISSSTVDRVGRADACCILLQHILNILKKGTGV